MSFWKNDFSALFKFYELEIWMYCMHTAHSLQGGHSRDWWARLSTPVLSVCPVFILVGIVSLANGRTANDGNPIHTWLTAPVKSCAVVTFPSICPFQASWTARSKLPDCLAAGFVQLLLPVILHQEMTRGPRGGSLLPRSRKVTDDLPLSSSMLRGCWLEWKRNISTSSGPAASPPRYIYYSRRLPRHFSKKTRRPIIFSRFTVDCFEGKYSS